MIEPITRVGYSSLTLVFGARLWFPRCLQKNIYLFYSTQRNIWTTFNHLFSYSGSNTVPFVVRGHLHTTTPDQVSHTHKQKATFDIYCIDTLKYDSHRTVRHCFCQWYSRWSLLFPQEQRQRRCHSFSPSTISSAQPKHFKVNSLHQICSYIETMQSHVVSYLQ